MDANVVAAKLAVNKIVKDIQNRQGLEDSWDEIEPYIQEEIKDQWVQIILTEME